MIEQGLVLLITSHLDQVAGFPLELPKDWVSTSTPQAWTYRGIISAPLYYLQGQNPLTSWEVQLDCHGYTMALAISLARNIDGVLRGGWRGVMSDADATVVQGIFRLPGQVDGYSDNNRTYVRSLEYKVIYVQI